MMRKSKGGCKRGRYDSQIKREDGKGGIMMWKLKGGGGRGNG